MASLMGHLCKKVCTGESIFLLKGSWTVVLAERMGIEVADFAEIHKAIAQPEGEEAN